VEGVALPVRDMESGIGLQYKWFQLPPELEELRRLAV
jgi:hypothetical protein